MDDDIDQWAQDLAFATSHSHTFVKNEPDAQRSAWLERMLGRAEALGLACVHRPTTRHDGAPGYQFGFLDSKSRDLFHEMVLADLNPAPPGQDRYSHDYSFYRASSELQDGVRLVAEDRLKALGIPYNMEVHSKGFTTSFNHFADRWLFMNMAACRILEVVALDRLRTRSQGNDRRPGLD